MQKTLFSFVKQAVSIARKLTDAAVMQISHPAGNSVAGWKHAVLHFLRVHMEATLAEVLDGAEQMDRVRAALVLVGGEERVQKYRHFTLRDVVGGGYAVLTVVGVQRGPHVAVTRTATVDVAPTWLTDRYEDTRRVAATAAAATREAGRTDGTAGDVFVALHG